MEPDSLISIFIFQEVLAHNTSRHDRCENWSGEHALNIVISAAEKPSVPHTHTEADGCIKVTRKWWLGFGRNIYHVYTVFRFWEWKSRRSGLNKTKHFCESINSETVNWDSFPQSSPWKNSPNYPESTLYCYGHTYTGEYFMCIA